MSKPKLLTKNSPQSVHVGGSAQTQEQHVHHWGVHVQRATKSAQPYVHAKDAAIHMEFDHYLPAVEDVRRTMLKDCHPKLDGWFNPLLDVYCVILSLYREIDQKTSIFGWFWCDQSNHPKVDGCWAPIVIHFWRRNLPRGQQGQLPNFSLVHGSTWMVHSFIITIPTPINQLWSFICNIYIHIDLLPTSAQSHACRCNFIIKVWRWSYWLNWDMSGYTVAY